MQAQTTTKRSSLPAGLFIGVIAACAAALLGFSVLDGSFHQPAYAAALLLMALLTARMKVTLPGLNGNMSVNLPFILVAVTQLSVLEALMVALPSIALQCLPKGGGKPKPAQMVFNLGTTVLAVELGSWVARQVSTPGDDWTSASVLLLLTGISFLFAQTLPVAAILTLTEGGKMPLVWSRIFLLSFPYYLLSVGVTSLMNTASQHMGWEVPLLALPVMYGVYRAYNVYFGRLMKVNAQHTAVGAS